MHSTAVVSLPLLYADGVRQALHGLRDEAEDTFQELAHGIIELQATTAQQQRTTAAHDPKKSSI